MAARTRARALRIAAGLVLLAYPLLVWRGLAAGSPRTVAAVLLLVLLPAAWLRLRAADATKARGVALVPLVTASALLLAAALDSLGFILVVPVAINLVMLAAFGSTLRGNAMPMIERFARLQESELSVDQQAWCRLWTKIWCGFFAVNATTAGTLAWFAPPSWWALYNGLLAYGIMGVLFGTEWWLRRRRFPPGEGDAPR